MHLQAAIAGLLLLLTDAVISYQVVRGVEGQPVTLPCTYSTKNGVTTMCWGHGSCPSSRCTDEFIYTDGYSITTRMNERYKLKGRIPEGDVSLTIENPAQVDSGLYCCRVEHRGWFNDMKLTMLLDIKPAGTPSVPTSTSITTFAPPTPTPTQNLKPASSLSPIPTTNQLTANSSTSTQSTATELTTPPEMSTSQSPQCSCPKDGNGTVTQSSHGPWHTTQTVPEQSTTPPMGHEGSLGGPDSTTQQALQGRHITDKVIYIIVSIIVGVLLLLLFFKIVKKHLCLTRKLQQLSMMSLNAAPIGALQSATEMRVRAEENIYVVEDNPYVIA